MSVDWTSVAETAFTRFVRTFKDSEDVDDAWSEFQEAFYEASMDNDVEMENGWEFDLPIETSSSIINKCVELGNGGGNKQVNGALHSSIHACLFETISSRGENVFESWESDLDRLEI